MSVVEPGEGAKGFPVDDPAKLKRLRGRAGVVAGSVEFSEKVVGGCALVGLDAATYYCFEHVDFLLYDCTAVVHFFRVGWVDTCCSRQRSIRRPLYVGAQKQRLTATHTTDPSKCVQPASKLPQRAQPHAHS